MSAQRFNRVTKYEALVGSQYCHSRLVPYSGESADCVSTLESVRGSYGSLESARDAALDSVAVSDQVLVEHVSFIFNTIELGSRIVCGLPVLPHDPVHELDARWRLLRVPR